MSVYKNGDGRWVADVTIQRADGTTKRVRKVSPVQTKRGAEKFELELREQMWSTKERPKESPTLGEWAEQFVAEHSVPSGLRESTIREQRRAYRLYILPILGGSMRITDVGQEQMHKVRAAMASKGLSSKTINNALGVLVKSLGHYYDSRELPRPNLRPPRAKVPKSPPKFWEPAEYEAIVAASAELGPAAHAAVLLMGDAGLRAGEVIALEWSHIRWGREPALLVQRSYTDGVFSAPKGGRHRTVPLTARAAAALQALPRSISVPWVLPHNGETHMEIHNLHQLAGNVERRAKLGKPKKRGQLHKLRHTYATRLVASGADTRSIQDLMGHAQLSTTEKYMHLVAGSGARAVAQLEQFDSRQDGGRPSGGRKKKTS